MANHPLDNPVTELESADFEMSIPSVSQDHEARDVFIPSYAKRWKSRVSLRAWDADVVSTLRTRNGGYRV